MGGAFASRLALEAAFLILLAVGSGFADLRPAAIVAVMACGWAIATVIEWLAWRAERQGALTTLGRPAAAARGLPGQPQEEVGWPIEQILVPEDELDEPAAGDEGTSLLPAEESPRHRWSPRRATDERRAADEALPEIGGGEPAR